jgi:hypothetical protein
VTSVSDWPQIVAASLLQSDQKHSPYDSVTEVLLQQALWWFFLQPVFSVPTSTSSSSQPGRQLPEFLCPRHVHVADVVGEFVILIETNARIHHDLLVAVTLDLLEPGGAPLEAASPATELGV